VAALSALLGLVVLVVVALAVIWLKDRADNTLKARRNPPEKLAEVRAAHERRLLAPDWEFYERHLQRPAPLPLRDLFSDHNLILWTTTLERGDIYVTSFEPLDAEGVLDTREWIGADVLPFASSDGDPIYLKPGLDQPNVVYITYHDGGDTEQLAPDVATFVDALKEARSNAI
jgi:hypothetical protein